MNRLGRYLSSMVLAIAVLAMPVTLIAQSTMPPAPYAYTQLDDPQQEAVARELMETLRCLQCQSQSIADSDAPVAGDMRHQVRVRIAAGEHPDEVRAYLISRYGDYISYDPQISTTTWPLFAVPVVLLLLAGLVMWRRLGRKGEAAT